MFWHADRFRLIAIVPQRSPRGCRSIYQIVGSNTRRSVREVSVNIRKNRAQEGDPFRGSLTCFLIVRHRSALIERPKADLRVNLKSPALALCSDRIVHLFDLGDDPKRLLAESSARLLAIDPTCGSVSCCRESRPTRCGEHACATWLTEQLSGCLVTRSRTVKQTNGNVDCEIKKIGGRLLSSFGRSTRSTDVASEGTSTLNATHPARHPSTPATNMRVGNYDRSASVTIIGVWSDGFSCPRGSLSISQPSSRFVSAGDNKKWSILIPRLFWNACRK